MKKDNKKFWIIGILIFIVILISQGDVKKEGVSLKTYLDRCLEERQEDLDDGDWVSPCYEVDDDSDDCSEWLEDSDVGYYFYARESDGRYQLDSDEEEALSCLEQYSTPITGGDVCDSDDYDNWDCIDNHIYICGIDRFNCDSNSFIGAVVPPDTFQEACQDLCGFTPSDCTETDNHKEYTKKGTTTGNPSPECLGGSCTDSCVGEDSVIEYYCGLYDGRVYSVGYPCEEGCIDGACISSCIDTVWSTEPSEWCEGQIFSQESNCGNLRTSVGTKTCPSGFSCIYQTCIEACVDTEWWPDVSEYCEGQSFMQESNCAKTRSAIGTKDCSGGCEDTMWSPSSTTICSGETFTQTSNCGTTRTALGTKACNGGEPGVVCVGNEDCDASLCQECKSGYCVSKCASLLQTCKDGKCVTNSLLIIIGLAILGIIMLSAFTKGKK